MKENECHLEDKRKLASTKQEQHSIKKGKKKRRK